MWVVQKEFNTMLEKDKRVSILQAVNVLDSKLEMSNGGLNNYLSKIVGFDKKRAQSEPTEQLPKEIKLTVF